MKTKPATLPPRHQNHQPGIVSAMTPPPEYIRANYRGSGKLEGKMARGFVFPASEEASYIIGQAVHPNSGEVLNT